MSLVESILRKKLVVLTMACEEQNGLSFILSFNNWGGWFAERGWPKGRLEELMEMVCEIKATGADQVFEPMRKARGGRVSVRKRKPDTDFQSPD